MIENDGIQDFASPTLLERARALVQSTPLPSDAWIDADWSISAPVRAFSTTRLGPGASLAPNQRFDLARAGSADGERQREAVHLLALQLARALPAAPRFVHQVHGTRVIRVDCADQDTTSEAADALYTQRCGVVLGVRHADCLPVLLSSADGTEIAAIHAGWRGLAAGVVEATVRCFECPAQRLRAWLGPAIGPRNFEVGADVRQAFLADDPQAAAAFSDIGGGKWLCDLYRLARQRLRRLGIENISGGELCTYADARRFYSHRRDAAPGRMASLIWRNC